MGVRKLKAVRREDVLTTTSQRSGAQWLLETFLRRFRTLSHIVFMFPVVLLCGLCLGVAAGQGVFVYQTFSSLSADWPAYLRYMALGCGFAFGYVTFGLTLLFLVPAVNFLLPLKLKPFRGPWFSLSTVPWYTHNALT
nr:hypothetical protein [Bdellovibrionales bacterium]